MRKIYFDSVSTTSIHPEVKNTYSSLLDNYYCNADALYDDGVKIYQMMEKSRENIADLLHIEKEEVIFTSGASEANNLAVKGLCFAHPQKKHLITSVYEHSSVYQAFVQLEESFGYEVTYLTPLDPDGKITAKQVDEAIREDTLLVSIMCVNNEVGIHNDISQIRDAVKKHPGVYFHSDLTQAIGKVDVDLKGIDLASFSAHKIHGLKGSGVLVKKKHVELLPLINGGQQEFGLRGGTSDALCDIVLAKTLRIALENQKKYHDHLQQLHDNLVSELKQIDGISINSPEGSICSLVSFSSPLTSEVMLNALNLKGIMVSSKSTCGSRKKETNRTLKALGIDDDHAIRVSFDYNNTTEEIAYFINSLKEIISKYG